jgi:DNA modification methylase
MTSKPGDFVLDPYAGSGTTLLAAQCLGRRWVGIELKPAFIDLMQRRLENW